MPQYDMTESILAIDHYLQAQCAHDSAQMLKIETGADASLRCARCGQRWTAPTLAEVERQVETARSLYHEAMTGLSRLKAGQARRVRAGESWDGVLHYEDLVIETLTTGSGWIARSEGVRITHMPTRIKVSSLSDRSAHRNKVLAMDQLKEELQHYCEVNGLAFKDTE